MPETTYGSRRQRLTARLEELLATPWKDRHAKRLIKRLRRHQNDLFTFLDQPCPFGERERLFGRRGRLRPQRLEVLL
jgi:hypothetical protein